MEQEVYNRRIRTTPFTYKDGLKLCYKLCEQKIKELDEQDIHNQNLSGDYKLTLLALGDMFNAGIKQAEENGTTIS